MNHKFFNFKSGGPSSTDASNCNGEVVAWRSRSPRDNRTTAKVAHTILLCFFAFFAMTNTSAQLPGTGTAEAPYTIATAEQLVEFAGYINENSPVYNLDGLHFKLIANIDLSEYGEEYNDGAGWIPIGNNFPATARFRGVFDGDGHIITGLYVNNSFYAYAGLFGYNQAGAVVKNLGVQDAVIVSGPATYTGGIAGLGTGAGNVIENCWFSGSITSNPASTAYVGAIAGDITTNAIVKNCYSTGLISASTVTIHAGGIVGRNNGSSVLNCWSTATIESPASTTSNVGGIAGTNTGTDAAIRNSVAISPYIKVINSTTANLGRVAGNQVTGATLENNAALSNMVNLPNGTAWNNKGLDQKDGADITIPQIIADGTLGNRFTTPIWTVENGKLPGLGITVNPPDFFTETIIYALVISPRNMVMKKGQTQTLTANVLGFNVIGDIEWSVYGGSEGTTISSSGELTIANDEEVPQVTVKAVLTEDITKTDETTVYIVIYDGEGTSTEPFIITTAAQLAQLAILINEGSVIYNDKFYKLGNDIDLSDYGIEYNDGKGWIPIGNLTFPFRGTFNGDNHKISGLYINSTVSYNGLFGTINYGVFTNLGLEEVNIFSTTTYSAGIAVNGRGSFTNCWVTGSITGGNYTAGITGSSSNQIISECWFDGTITGSSFVGGITGRVNYNAEISNCYTSGTIIGAAIVGGVVGYNAGSVSNCWTTAYITGVTVGGIAGYCDEETIISNCAALNPAIKTVSGIANMGRIVGSNDGAFLTNNIAFNDMLRLPYGEDWINVGASLNDGADFSAEDILEDDGTFNGRFTAPVWTTENGRLPGFGETLPIPNYLLGVPYILDINIEPKMAAIKRGNTQLFESSILGVYITEGGVTWSVTGGSSSETAITPEGLLTIGSDETVLVLVVKATSTDDTSVSQTTLVFVDYFTGEGTEESPYIITTAAELAMFSDVVNMGSALRTKHFKLGNDLDLSDYGEDYNDGAGWIKIGDNIYPFSGVFDGDGHIITGLYINNTNFVYTGLFGYSTGTIKNLGLTDINISSTRNNTGGLLGYNFNANVLNCYATGSVSGLVTAPYVGGLVGNNEGAIRNSYFIGTVINTSNQQYTGGLVGCNWGTISEAIITNCYFIGDVIGSYIAGGIAGVNGMVGVPFVSKIENCYSMGSVSVNPQLVTSACFVGGIVGISWDGVIVNCWSTAEMRGFSLPGYLNSLGGIAGYAANSISNCAALNPRFIALPGAQDNAGGRISRNGIFSNNVAYENMLNQNGNTTWINKGLNAIDGADISILDIQTDATLGGRFLEENGWTVENGKLPGLIGNAVDMPYYLFLPTDIYEISGKITGNNAPEGIEGALVTVSSPGFPTVSTYTDENGDYLIEEVYDTKTYTVKIEAIGYVPDFSTVTITGANIEKDVQLTEIPFPVSNVVAVDEVEAAVITWNEPGETSIFRHDSGVSSNSVLGINSRYGVLGSVYRVGATIDKISWLLGNNHPTVDVFIFGLNSDGTPNRLDLVYLAMDVPNTSLQWCEHELPMPVYMPNGFFIGISASNGLNTSLMLDVPNGEYPFQSNTNFYTLNYTQRTFSPFEQANYFANAMIRAEGIGLGPISEELRENNEELTGKNVETVLVNLSENTNINSPDRVEALSESANLEIEFFEKNLLTVSERSQRTVSERSRGGVYKIWLLEDGSPENAWIPVADNVTETEFIDDEIWITMPAGAYRYAVRAVYTDNVLSPVVFSNLLGKDWEVDYRINITTSTGVPATGAIVTMINQDGNPDHVYTAVSGTNGILLEGIWRGIYDLTITLEGFYDYWFSGLDTEGGLTHNATLMEIPYPVFSIKAEIDNNKVIVEWFEPVPLTQFRFDSGVIPPAAALGFDGGGSRSVMGSCHNVNATLSSMSWFVSGSASNLVNVYVFELNSEGNPSNTILHSELDVPNNIGAWTNYDFIEPVEAPNGFYIALSHNTEILGLGLNSATTQYPFKTGTHFYSVDYQMGYFNALDAGDYIGNFMIRAEGMVNGEKTLFGDSPSLSKGGEMRGVTGYDVFRLEKGQDEDDWTPLQSNFDGLTYTDNTWSGLPMGDYLYAVKAIYTGGVLSTAKRSNVVEKDMRVNIMINILTNSGHPATGAVVKLTNQNGNLLDVYTKISGAEGVLFENIRKGMYIVSVTLSGYEDHFSYNANFMQDGSYNVELLDIIGQIDEVTAKIVGNNAVVEWKVPTLEITYKWDDGTPESGVAISENAGQWLGNIFPVGEEGLLTSIDVYGVTRTGSSQTRMLTLDIFNASFELVGSSAPFLLPQDDWLNIPLENIPYSGTFYAMIRWPNAPGETNYIGMDTNGPNAGADYSMFSGNGTTVRTWRAATNGQSVCVFMIRANAKISGGKSVNYEFLTEPSDKADYSDTPLFSYSATPLFSYSVTPLFSHSTNTSPSRALMGYTIYRLEEGQPESNWDELADDVMDTEYVDTEWSSLVEGTYQYAVKAKFGSGDSDAVLSNTLVKETTIFYTVTVIAGTGGTVEIDGYTGLSAEIEAGTSVTVKATANQNYDFIEWTDTETGETISSLPVYSFTVSEDVTLVANFELVGINGIGISGYTIYPNPAQDELRIKNYELRDGLLSRTLSAVEVEVFDVFGRNVLSEIVNHKYEIVINVSSLPAGVYMIRLFDGQNYVTQRFVKK